MYGEYEIVILLNDNEENGVCVDIFNEQVLLENYFPDYEVSFSPGMSSEQKNMFIEIEGIDADNFPLVVEVIDTENGDIICTELFFDNNSIGICNDLNFSETYCLKFILANGCIFDDCVVVEGQSCFNELNITLVELIDECNEFSDGSITVSVDGTNCGGLYNVGWSSGDTGPTADHLKAGTYCVYVFGKGACENCQSIAYFDVGTAPGECENDLPCEERIANEVIIKTETIFFNTSTNNCDGGSFTFDASGSSAFPVFITENDFGTQDGCVDFSGIELTENNPVFTVNVNCKDLNMNTCAGKYCFDVDRPNCPTATFCRTIKFCQGKSRASNNISCLEQGEGGGQTGSESIAGKEEVPPSPKGDVSEIGSTERAALQRNLTSLTLTKVYPNPFVTDINIRLESIDHQTVEIQLIDIYGKTVISKSQQLTKGVNQIKLQPFANLASGIYALTVTDQNQKKYTQLITRMNN